MQKIKIDPDVKRFARYQSVINLLLAKESFHKSDVYKDLKDEKPQFIGRVISELTKDGYLTNSGSKTKLQYSWSVKREEFKAGRWIDHRIFTATVKRSPYTDRPRERLLRLGPSGLKISELLAILIRAGLRGELVPTEAELARREARSYESASELLDRIKSDREISKTSTSDRRRRVNKRLTQ
jgi:hypothetical protein